MIEKYDRCDESRVLGGGEEKHGEGRSGDAGAHSVTEGGRKSCRERANRNLWATGSGRDFRVDSGIDLRRHKAAPEELGPALADLRFEIQSEERVKEIVGKEGDQQEALDGVGVVPIDMVGMPALDQFIESMILDIPPLVTET